MKQLRKIILVVLSLALSGIPTGAEENPSTDADVPREELGLRAFRGLERVSLFVLPLELEGERYGLTRDLFKLDAELRLRKAGIRIYEQATLEWSKAKGSPILWVEVTVGRSRTEYVCPVEILVQLRQNARLERNDALLPAVVTWQTSGLTLCQTEEDLKDVRERVGDHIDMFINEFLKANPIDRSEVEQKNKMY